MADDASSFLTITELADRLGVSESTIRNWRHAYRDLIPVKVGRDGFRRYSLARFRYVAMLRGRNLPPAEIRAALAEQEGETTQAETFESRVLAYLERIATAVERIADRMEHPED